MRLNKFIALSSSLSRRAADTAIEAGRVTINGAPARQGADVAEADVVLLDGQVLHPPRDYVTLLMHKPVGVVVSRNGQGSRTIYDILPPEYQQLNAVGRLDKDSSGLLVLTNDGQLAQTLTHPSKQKIKVYEITLDKPLQPLHRQLISDHGITLEDGISQLQLARRADNDEYNWIVTMREGRNRQIRRTFYALGYMVVKLHRTQFGEYSLANLKPGQIKPLT